MKLESLKSINKDVLDKTSLKSITGGAARKTNVSGNTSHNGVAYSTDRKHYSQLPNGDWQYIGGAYSLSDADMTLSGADLVSKISL